MQFLRWCAAESKSIYLDNCFSVATSGTGVAAPEGETILTLCFVCLYFIAY